ncbi:galactoside 2-alpha-L-fucosyltransferase-like [Miscanthus floridulus]|uniref:galactoside 2-alpha-L-fucosyltransferase-like n=1 Tax=Miscanthus floridulus TaxID=154761 RepID=UPI003459A4B6
MGFCCKQGYFRALGRSTSSRKPTPPPTSGHGSGNGNGSNKSTAIFIVSLYTNYYKSLRSRKKGVFQRTPEEQQARRSTCSAFPSRRSITSELSTFGYVSSSLAGVCSAILLTTFDHKVPETPCQQAMSMEPCNLVPPQGLECRGKPVDKDDLARHVGVCEDFKDGVKFYD